MTYPKDATHCEVCGLALSTHKNPERTDYIPRCDCCLDGDARADLTMERLPIINDPAVSEMVKDLD